MFEFIQYILVLVSGGLLMYVFYWQNTKESEVPAWVRYFAYWIIFAALTTVLAQHHGFHF